MTVQGNVYGGWTDMLKRSAIGSGVFLLAMMLGNALSAWLIVEEHIPESAAGYCILVNLIVSIVAGNLVAARKTSERRLILALMVSTCCFLSLVILKLLCFPGDWNGVGVTAGMLAGCGAALALLTSGQGKGSVKHKNRKKVL